jgi:hypothetical protein
LVQQIAPSLEAAPFAQAVHKNPFSGLLMSHFAIFKRRFRCPVGE